MTQGFLYSIISAACFGMLVIFFKQGYQIGLDAISMLQFRFTFGTALLFVWLALRRPDQLKASFKMIAFCSFLGILISPIQSICFASAAKYIPASTTSLILYFYPVAVTLLSAVFFGTRIDRTVSASLALVLAGCGLVFYDAFLQQMDTTGLTLAFGAMITFSIYLIMVQILLKKEEPLRATFYILLFASITYNCMGGVHAYSLLNATNLPIALGLGLISTVFAMAFLYLGIEKVGSTYASIFSSIEPVTTLVAAAIILDEKIVPLQIGGVILIIAGILLPNIHISHAKLSQHLRNRL